MRSGTRRSRVGRALAVAGAVGGLLAGVEGAPVFWNPTPSLPRGLYLATSEGPARGRLAVICLPGAASRLGLRRRYLRPGNCPTGARPVLKRLVGMQGDRVVVDVGGVEINGHRLPASAPRSRDAAGRPLTPYCRTVRLATDEWWLFAARTDSWDSRYYGPVPGRCLRTIVRPLLTWGDPSE